MVVKRSSLKYMRLTIQKLTLLSVIFLVLLELSNNREDLQTEDNSDTSNSREPSSEDPEFHSLSTPNVSAPRTGDKANEQEGLQMENDRDLNKLNEPASENLKSRTSLVIDSSVLNPIANTNFSPTLKREPSVVPLGSTGELSIIEPSPLGLEKQVENQVSYTCSSIKSSRARVISQQ